MIDGDLTIRDATNKISTKGKIEVQNGELIATSKFNISPEDYKINIPGVVREKINKEMEVTVSMKYSPLASK